MDVVMDDVSLSNGRIEEDMEIDEVVETEIFTETETDIFTETETDIFTETETEKRIKINFTKRSITIYL